jgi:hypothetical protein
LIGGALTRGDVFGCLRGVFAFFLVLVAPGHCVGWITNLFGFRKRGAVQQATWSVALSFALTPIAAVMLGKYCPAAVAWWLAMACVAVTIGTNIWAHHQDKDKRFRWARVLGLAIGVAWVGFVVAELVDLGVGNHLYLSVTVFDHALRTAFVDAVMRTGVPPANPLYWPGHAAPMRYYYFWYVLTADAARLGGVTAHQAVIASVVWAGFGLAAMVALYCRHFLGMDEAGGGGRRWPRTALALLAVTGLDILPVMAMALFGVPTDPDMEWWSSDKVTSWMDSILWVPHHIAGLVCCLFGFLLVWMSKGASVRQRCLCGVVAGISFASAFGLSVWVPVAFALAMVAWLVWALVWEPESRARVPVLLGAGAVAVLALVPYLRELRAARADAGGTSPMLEFGVRHIIDPDGLLAVRWIAEVARAHPTVERAIAEIALLVPGYFVELGFFGLVLVVALRAARRVKLDEATRTAVVLAAAGLAVATFLRSTVIEYNDFGFRSILIAQFFLLLLAVRWREGAFGLVRRPVRVVMLAMVWIGVAGTVYQAIELRVYLPVEETLGRVDEAGLSERAIALRRGFDAMDRRIPETAVVQFNTEQPSDFFRYAQVLQVRRQVANALPECASAFGGEASACSEIQKSVARLFTPVAGAALSGAQARVECGSLGVDDLVATRWDRVWFDRQGWVWTLPAVVDTGDVRVVDCGD